MRNDAEETSAVYLVVRGMMGIAAALAFGVYAAVLAVMAVLLVPAALFRALTRLATKRPATAAHPAQTMRVDNVVIQPRERAEAGVC